MTEKKTNPFITSDIDIPNFTVPEQDFAFPAGLYVFAFGEIKGVFSEGNTFPEAVLHELWVLRYLGNEDMAADEKRIEVIDNFVRMGLRGVKLVERYPNPALKPTLAWRAKSFFSKFDCITDVPTGEMDEVTGKQFFTKVVDWKKVKAKYGVIFTAVVTYVESPKGGNYRNIDYKSIKPTGTFVPPEHMKLIEEKYEALRELENQSMPGKPASAEDLPF